MAGWWNKQIVPHIPDLTKLNVVGMGGTRVQFKVGSAGAVNTVSVAEFIGLCSKRCGN